MKETLAKYDVLMSPAIATNGVLKKSWVKSLMSVSLKDCCEKSFKVAFLERRWALKTILILAFVLFFTVMMVRAIIGAYTLTPTSTADDLMGRPLWQIPLVYVRDYAQHG